jgi:hypothetical protein
MAFPPGLLGSGKAILPSVVPFPRGFALAPDGRVFLASGTSPSGDGDNTILAFAPDLTPAAERFVDDTQLSPLDLAIAPNGNVLVSSEFPFGGRMQSPPFANTTPGVASSYASFRPMDRWASASRAACALDLTATSTASPTARSSPSISAMAASSAPWPDWTASTGRQSSSFRYAKRMGSVRAELQTARG